VGAATEWHPPPLVGQVVLITTCNKDGTTNIAPKCWASMVASTPPHLAFNCNREHWTAQNVLRSREFVVNIPGAELADRVWRVSRLPHPRRVEDAGFTALPAHRVKPPRISECKAHLECTLVEHKDFGQEVWLLGRVVAASADPEVASANDPFGALRSFVYLAPGTYGIIGRARRAHEPRSPPS
jgi:flavin reductase (DIM6/NTAB) family NADH-FMN oxidoreductase RutF